MLSWVQYTFKIAALSWSNSGVPDTVYETKKVDSQPQQPQQTPQLYPATITFWYWAGVFLSQTNTDMHVCSQTHRLKATVKRSRLALEPKEDLVAVIVDIMYQSPFACMHAYMQGGGIRKSCIWCRYISETLSCTVSSTVCSVGAGSYCPTCRRGDYV